MGTRNLTVVKLDNEYKVAQYGQWDGYPEGQGKTILAFLGTCNLSMFKKKLRESRFLLSEEIKTINKRIDEEKGYSLKEHYPLLSRDHGAEILPMILATEGVAILQNSLNLAGDSLFCEWVYVVDLDSSNLEVFDGFNKEPLSEVDRFHDIPRDEGSSYYPVKLVKSYSLDDLPTVEQMVKDCSAKEEVEV